MGTKERNWSRTGSERERAAEARSQATYSHRRWRCSWQICFAKFAPVPRELRSLAAGCCERSRSEGEKSQNKNHPIGWFLFWGYRTKLQLTFLRLFHFPCPFYSGLEFFGVSNRIEPCPSFICQKITNRRNVIK